MEIFDGREGDRGRRRELERVRARLEALVSVGREVAPALAERVDGALPCVALPPRRGADHLI